MPGKVWSKRPCVIKMTKFNGRKMFVHFPECLLTGFRLCVIFNKKIQKICSGPLFLSVRLCSFFWNFLANRGPSVLFVPSGWYKASVSGHRTKGYAPFGFHAAANFPLPVYLNNAQLAEMCRKGWVMPTQKTRHTVGKQACHGLFFRERIELVHSIFNKEG